MLTHGAKRPSVSQKGKGNYSTMYTLQSESVHALNRSRTGPRNLQGSEERVPVGGVPCVTRAVLRARDLGLVECLSGPFWDMPHGGLLAMTLHAPSEPSSKYNESKMWCHSPWTDRTYW